MLSYSSVFCVGSVTQICVGSVKDSEYENRAQESVENRRKDLDKF